MPIQTIVLLSWTFHLHQPEHVYSQTLTRRALVHLSVASYTLPSASLYMLLYHLVGAQVAIQGPCRERFWSRDRASLQPSQQLRYPEKMSLLGVCANAINSR